MTRFAVGTRASKLALVQTDHVLGLLRAAHPAIGFDVLHISTRGDKITDRPLAELGRNGVFVTEIENALRSGDIDFAVHSAKDLPSRLAPDMRIAALLAREDPRDVLVSRGGPLSALPAGARVGTSSPRRAAQLRALRPDLQSADVRGNVDTRLRRLAEGHYDALLLAAAGLVRLGRADEITEWLEPTVMLPAVGQGALAIECRAGDRESLELVAGLHHPPTGCAVEAERAFLAELGGDCTAVAGALGTVMPGGVLHLVGVLSAADGRLVRGEADGPAADATVGAALARRLRAAAATVATHAP